MAQQVDTGGAIRRIFLVAGGYPPPGRRPEGEKMKGQVRWTSEEDECLRELAKTGKSVNEINQEMGRSRGSIRQRAEVLAVRIAKVVRHLR